MAPDPKLPMPWLWSPEKEDRKQEELRIPLQPELPPVFPEIKKDEDKPERGVDTWDF